MTKFTVPSESYKQFGRALSILAAEIAKLPKEEVK
jgi:hypothetical protein